MDDVADGTMMDLQQKIAKYIFLLAAIAISCPGSAVFCADYEILEKTNSIRIETASLASEHHKQVVRILKDEGVSYKEYLAVNNNIQIKNLKVTIATADGKSYTLKSDSIYEVPLVESPDMVTDYKAIVIDPENLTRGDVITIEYDRVIKSLLYISSWVYASNVPIRRSACNLSYPTSLPVKFRGEDDSIKITKADHDGIVTIQMESAKQQEVHLTGQTESMWNVEKRVVFMPEQAMTEKWTLSTRSWPDVARWFTDLTRFAYQDDPQMDSVVLDIKRRTKSNEEIAEALYQYIQKNFTYMAIEIGIGGYKPRFAAQTFRKKYGDCKDLTFLYLVLLRKAGIEAYPALVDTRHAKFFYKDFPSPIQFNHCIAYLPGIRKGIWVDTTVKNFRLGEMPVVIQGKQALVAGGPNKLVQIPEDFYTSNVLRFEFVGAYKESLLTMTGAVHTLGQANEYVELMKNALLRNSVKNYVYSNLLKQGLPIQNMKSERSGERSIQLSFATPVQELDSYKMLLVNAVNYSALENLGVDPQENEFYSLGIPIRLVWDSTIDLPGHVLVSPGGMKEKKGENLWYKLELKEENGKLRYLADVYFANGFLNHVEMRRYIQELQDFTSLLQRTVVIR